VLTFLAYMLFHATRKPPSIVKSVLKGDQMGSAVLAGGHKLLQDDVAAVTNYGWAPFNQPGGQVGAGPGPGCHWTDLPAPAAAAAAARVDWGGPALPSPPLPPAPAPAPRSRCWARLT